MTSITLAGLSGGYPRVYGLGRKPGTDVFGPARPPEEGALAVSGQPS